MCIFKYASCIIANGHYCNDIHFLVMVKNSVCRELVTLLSQRHSEKECLSKTTIRLTVSDLLLFSKIYMLFNKYYAQQMHIIVAMCIFGEICTIK